MIDAIIVLLEHAGIHFGFFRLMDYLVFRALMGMATSLGLTLLFGFRLIALLYEKGYRDTSGDFLSIDTGSKRGTPTAGGIMILIATTLSVVLWARFENPFVLPLLIGFLYCGLVGFLDDALKVRFKSSLSGMGQLAKTFLLLLFAIPFALYFVSPLNPVPENLRTLINLPFVKPPVLHLAVLVFATFVVFTVFSIVNSVNITDGLDGLLASTSVVTIGVYVVFAWVLENTRVAERLLFSPIPGAGEVAVFGTILMGSVLGFLWYNAYPAEVFMGDTGSLAIGAALAMMALFTKQEMLFIIVGGVYVLEIFTSLVQEKIGSRFGRRIFYRAPYHHSMVHRGIAETKTVTRIWILSLLLGLVGLLSLKIR